MIICAQFGKKMLYKKQFVVVKKHAGIGGGGLKKREGGLINFLLLKGGDLIEDLRYITMLSYCVGILLLL